MVRFGISLLAAAAITVGGYSALGAATAPAQLKVIATVYAHAHRHPAAAAIAMPQPAPVSPG